VIVAIVLAETPLVLSGRHGPTDATSAITCIHTVVLEEAFYALIICLICCPIHVFAKLLSVGGMENEPIVHSK
jgi:hypothetical protein